MSHKTSLSSARTHGKFAAHMSYALYYATSPAPANLSTHDAMNRLVPVLFSTEKDALHAAALVLRGGQFVWLLEGPDVRYTAKEVEERCKPILQLFSGKPPAGA
jgi:hypothetical protein